MCHKSGGCMNKGPFYYHLKFIICKICFNDSEATKMSPKQWTKPTAVFWEYVVFYFSNFILRISSRHVEFPRVSSWQPTAVRQTISNFYNPFFKFPTFKYKYFVLFNTNRVEPVHCDPEPDSEKLKCLHPFYINNYDSNDKNCYYYWL